MICNYVSSSNLSQVCYDAPTATLDISFHSGGVYRYVGVPQGVYAGLVSAVSHGSYFARHIKNRYPCHRL
jgi:hypothetical protein